MLRIRINNMNCGGCAKGVLATLQGVAPDAKPEFDLAAKEVRIEAPDAAAIIAALHVAGWQARHTPD